MVDYNQMDGYLNVYLHFSRDTSRKAKSEIGTDSNGAAPKASFLDSMKSLYATISKATLAKIPQRPKTPNFSTDQGTNGAPKRPPRKPRSQTSVSDSHHKSMSNLNTSLNQSRTTLDGRTWDVHSTNSSTLPR